MTRTTRSPCQHIAREAIRITRYTRPDGVKEWEGYSLITGRAFTAPTRRAALQRVRNYHMSEGIA